METLPELDAAERQRLAAVLVVFGETRRSRKAASDVGIETDDLVNELYIDMVENSAVKRVLRTVVVDSECSKILNVWAKRYLANYLRRERRWRSRNLTSHKGNGESESISENDDLWLLNDRTRKKRPSRPDGGLEPSREGAATLEVDEQLSLLPPKVSSAVEGRLAGLSVCEVARVAGVSRRTIYNRLQVAATILEICGEHND